MNGTPVSSSSGRRSRAARRKQRLRSPSAGAGRGLGIADAAGLNVLHQGWPPVTGCDAQRLDAQRNSPVPLSGETPRVALSLSRSTTGLCSRDRRIGWRVRPSAVPRRAGLSVSNAACPVGRPWSMNFRSLAHSDHWTSASAAAPTTGIQGTADIPSVGPKPPVGSGNVPSFVAHTQANTGGELFLHPQRPPECAPIRSAAGSDWRPWLPQQMTDTDFWSDRLFKTGGHDH